MIACLSPDRDDISFAGGASRRFWLLDAQAASGTCAMTQSIIEPQLGRVSWNCGSIALGDMVSFRLAARARGRMYRRLTPTAWGYRPYRD